MLLGIYRRLLKLPTFKGKSRITEGYRQLFFSPKSYRIIHGLQMDIDGFDWIQSDVLRDGCAEPLTCALMGKILKDGDTYVDVGAQFGLHTLVARHFVGANGKVIAVEPQPSNCHKLLTNWRLNGFENLTLYVGAIGDYDGSIALHLQSATDTSRLSLCLTPVNDQPQLFQVPINRLETILDQARPDAVRLLKIDIEGYELEAIGGIGRYVDLVEHIILEVLDSESGITEKSKELLQVLSDHGYVLRTVEGKPWDNNHERLPENNLWASRIAVNAKEMKDLGMPAQHSTGRGGDTAR
jgi:FkbM family methyltransferase